MGFAPKFAFWFSSWAVLVIIGIYAPGHLPAPYSYILIPIGLFLLFYGLLLNSIAGRTLKIYGHFDIKHGIKKPDKLVSIGIYECMRHPAQFGSIFFGIGIALLTSNIYSMLAAGWYAALALYFILGIEERETLKEFGDEYAEFLRTRRPFSFSLRCLKRGIKAVRK